MLSDTPIWDTRDWLAEEWAQHGSTHAIRMKTFCYYVPVFSLFLTRESSSLLLGSKWLPISQSSNQTTRSTKNYCKNCSWWISSNNMHSEGLNNPAVKKQGGCKSHRQGLYWRLLFQNRNPNNNQGVSKIICSHRAYACLPMNEVSAKATIFKHAIITPICPKE